MKEESPEYDAAFFGAHRDGALRSARAVIPLLLELMPCGSVVDVGCGTGTWLAAFREHGATDLLGIDGDYVNRDALDISPAQFQVHDLERPLRLDRRFDLVLSLEVAEHLPASAARPFVRSITALGPVVLFSAAIPFQAGRNHVNEQWPCYWAALFGERGYVAIDCLRRKVWRDDRVEWWYAQNMVLYVERDSLDQYPRLAREAELVESPPLSIVHPKRYLEWVEWWIANSERG